MRIFFFCLRILAMLQNVGLATIVKVIVDLDSENLCPTGWTITMGHRSDAHTGS
jgi:hypothetical protein